MLESDQPPERPSTLIRNRDRSENEEPKDLKAWIAAHEASLADFVLSLSDLTDRLDEKQVSMDNLDLALHQLEALKTFTWAGLDPMVHFCTPGLQLCGRRLSPEFIAARLKIACDEYVIKGTRLIMRRSLAESARTVSLSELAREVFNPQTDEYGDYRRRLRDNIIPRMQDIGLWNAIDLGVKRSENGNDFHRGYEISAGPILMAFHRYIYKPWSIQHAKFACKLFSKMES